MIWKRQRDACSRPTVRNCYPNEKELRIEATSRSFWFGRISDIVIRVRPAGTGRFSGVRVDLRSESREGERDHGRNVALLKAFFRVFRF